MVTRKQLMRTFKSWHKNNPTARQRTLQLQKCGKKSVLKSHSPYVMQEHANQVKVGLFQHIFAHVR